MQLQVYMIETTFSLTLLINSTKEIFCPITLGGGIRSLEDIEKALKFMSDKVAINSHAIENPQFIKQAVENFGSRHNISKHRS